MIAGFAFGSTIGYLVIGEAIELVLHQIPTLDHVGKQRLHFSSLALAINQNLLDPALLTHDVTRKADMKSPTTKQPN